MFKPLLTIFYMTVSYEMYLFGRKSSHGCDINVESELGKMQLPIFSYQTFMLIKLTE